jgi:hypothetical protein
MNYRLMARLGAFVIIVGGISAAITGDRAVWPKFPSPVFTVKGRWRVPAAFPHP